MVMVVALVAATLLGTASASPAEGIQPLSKIAVHMATVEIQPSAYMRTTPSLLGEQVHTRTPYVHHAGRRCLKLFESHGACTPCTSFVHSGKYLKASDMTGRRH